MKNEIPSQQESKKVELNKIINPLLIRQLQKFKKEYTQLNQTTNSHLLSLYTTSKTLFTQINNLLVFTQQISSSVRLSKQLEQQKHKQEERKQQQVKQNNNNQLKQIPVFVIKDIKTQRRVRQININNVANKLKVLVSKTLQRQSSLVQHNYSSYTNILKEEANQFKFIQIYQNVREQFIKIRKNFSTINTAEAMMYRNHPSYFVFHKNSDFFVSFYVQRLLFFQDRPLPFNGNLLFVPILLTKQKNIQTNKISYATVQHSFMRQLSLYNQHWQNFCLQLIFKNANTSQIIYYVCAYYQKKIYQSQICSLLRKIRCFVYFSILFNYLNVVIDKNISPQRKKSLRININEEIYLQINTNRLMENEKQSNATIIQDFLKYFDQKNIKQRAQTSKQQAHFNLQNYLKLLLAKLKNNTKISDKYINLKPKYIYVGQQRVQI